MMMRKPGLVWQSRFFSVLRWEDGAGDGVAGGSFREADGSREDWSIGLAGWRREIGKVGAMLLVWGVLQYTYVLCCLIGVSCNIRRFYVACLDSLATYRCSMLLVWAVLQHTDVLCCLFG